MYGLLTLMSAALQEKFLKVADTISGSVAYPSSAPTTTGQLFPALLLQKHWLFNPQYLTLFMKRVEQYQFFNPGPAEMIGEVYHIMPRRALHSASPYPLAIQPAPYASQASAQRDPFPDFAFPGATVTGVVGGNSYHVANWAPAPADTDAVNLFSSTFVQGNGYKLFWQAINWGEVRQRTGGTRAIPYGAVAARNAPLQVSSLPNAAWAGYELADPIDAPYGLLPNQAPMYIPLSAASTWGYDGSNLLPQPNYGRLIDTYGVYTTYLQTPVGLDIALSSAAGAGAGAGQTSSVSANTGGIALLNHVPPIQNLSLAANYTTGQFSAYGLDVHTKDNTVSPAGTTTDMFYFEPEFVLSRNWVFRKLWRFKKIHFRLPPFQRVTVSLNTGVERVNMLNSLLAQYLPFFSNLCGDATLNNNQRQLGNQGSTNNGGTGFSTNTAQSLYPGVGYFASKIINMDSAAMIPALGPFNANTTRTAPNQPQCIPSESATFSPFSYTTKRTHGYTQHYSLIRFTGTKQMYKKPASGYPVGNPLQTCGGDLYWETRHNLMWYLRDAGRRKKLVGTLGKYRRYYFNQDTTLTDYYTAQPYLKYGNYPLPMANE